MPTTEWLNKYDAIKDKLTCKDDLEAHFTEKVIGNMAVDVLDIGVVHFPTGQIFACDPLVELEDTLPFLQTIPAGTYPVKICVVPSEKYGDRYACVKVEVSREKPVRYELGMTGKEDLDEELDEDEYFGFGVDAGMGCVADIQTQAAFKAYWAHAYFHCIATCHPQGNSTARQEGKVRISKSRGMNRSVLLHHRPTSREAYH